VTSAVPGCIAQHADFLRQRGAADRPHSGRNLLEHLAGTWQLLDAWGNPPEVCLGGLYHSVYGTNAFQHETIPPEERAVVQAVVGTAAETLAYVFCSITRPRALLRPAYGIGAAQEVRLAHRRHPDVELTVTREQLRDLLELEAANLVEQGSGGSAIRELFLLDLEGGPWLSAGARAALKDVLRQAPRPLARSAWPAGTRVPA
jgi:hypothetical protein